MKSFVKWVGGKRQLLEEIKAAIPSIANDATYFEPFTGGGAVALEMQFPNAVLNDMNRDLMLTYISIRDKLPQLLEQLDVYRNSCQIAASREDYYYLIRDMDKEKGFVHLSPVVRAARFIFLNKNTFNGLYRVNKQGEFNAPFGRYDKCEITGQKIEKDCPPLYDRANFEAISKYLNSETVQLTYDDFELSVESAKKGDFVYFDPPYDGKNVFTGYTSEKVTPVFHVRLKNVVERLDQEEVNVLISYGDTPLIRELYKDFNIREVQARRSINSKGSGRGKVGELLISNN